MKHRWNTDKNPWNLSISYPCSICVLSVAKTSSIRRSPPPPRAGRLVGVGNLDPSAFPRPPGGRLGVDQDIPVAPPERPPQAHLERLGREIILRRVGHIP